MYILNVPAQISQLHAFYYDYEYYSDYPNITLLGAIHVDVILIFINLYLMRIYS